MKTLEVIRKMDGFEKRLADFIKQYNEFKDKVNSKEKSKKVDIPKSKTKKFKE